MELTNPAAPFAALDPPSLRSRRQSSAARTVTRAQAERAESRLQALLEDVSDLVLLLRADGEIEYASPSALRILGLPPERLAGRSLFEFLHPEDDALRPIVLQAVSAAEAVPLPEFRLRHQDGSWLRMEAAARNLLADPGVAGLVLTARDVTGRRTLEEQLRQSQKMEAIGELAGGIAHDFNNMLAIIMGYCEVMLNSDTLDETMRRPAERILTTSERAVALTKRLLSFSRKRMFAPRPLKLDALARESAAILRPLLNEKIRLHLSAEDDTWPVLADSGHLDQVIMNLTVNARDAMPRGGKLTIETANLELPANVVHGGVTIPAGRYATLSVSDTGSGMDPQTLQHIFDPFFTTKENGTGLGLAIVYGVIKQNRGYITVSSEPGRGSRFLVYLPALPAAPAVPAPAAGALAQTA